MVGMSRPFGGRTRLHRTRCDTGCAPCAPGRAVTARCPAKPGARCTDNRHATSMAPRLATCWLYVANPERRTKWPSINTSPVSPHATVVQSPVTTVRPSASPAVMRRKWLNASGSISTAPHSVALHHRLWHGQAARQRKFARYARAHARPARPSATSTRWITAGSARRCAAGVRTNAGRWPRLTA